MTQRRSELRGVSGEQGERGKRRRRGGGGDLRGGQEGELREGEGRSEDGCTL